MGIDDLMEELTLITAQLALLEEDSKRIRKELLKQMQGQRITDLENDSIKVHLVKGFSRTSIDKDKLKKLFPGALEVCSRSSWVDDFVKVTSND